MAAYVPGIPIQIEKLYALGLERCNPAEDDQDKSGSNAPQLNEQGCGLRLKSKQRSVGQSQSMEST